MSADQYPSVAKQGWNTRPVLTGEAHIRNYNSGMCCVGEQRYLATRRFNPDSWQNEIVIRALAGDTARYVTTLKLPRMHGRESHEDARLFWFNGKLHCAYTEGQYWERPWVAVQKLAVLRPDWSVEKVHTIPFGENSTGTEKNWQFFSIGGVLYFTYSLDPHVVVELDRDYIPKRIHQGTGGHRTLRGGTPPEFLGTTFLTFAHYHVAHAERSRRYGMTAVLFDAAPPFNIIAQSGPLIRASADDPHLPNKAYPHWNPLVIFPCGALYDGKTFTVSAGVNDSYDILIDFPRHELFTQRLFASPSAAL